MVTQRLVLVDRITKAQAVMFFNHQGKMDMHQYTAFISGTCGVYRLALGAALITHRPDWFAVEGV